MQAIASDAVSRAEWRESVQLNPEYLWTDKPSEPKENDDWPETDFLLGAKT
jgi:hypothetical protein